MHVVQPDVVGLVIAFVYGRIESLGIQTDPLGQKFPCPRNSFFLEVIAEGEVAQHLEESAVAGRLSHVLQVTRADALLAGGHAPSGRDLFPCEIGLKGSHSGVDDQKALVVVRHQRKAVHSQMSLALKELQEHFTKFIYAVILHFKLFLQRFIQGSQSEPQRCVRTNNTTGG